MVKPDMKKSELTLESRPPKTTKDPLDVLAEKKQSNREGGGLNQEKRGKGNATFPEGRGKAVVEL